LVETPQEAYDRGTLAGEISARLAGHDNHFAAINGHLAALAIDVHAMSMAVQRLADQRDADILTVQTTATAVEKTVRSTAEAVEDARVVRRDASEQRWSPWQKLIAVAGGVAALAVVVAFIIKL
jgi:hypothetical protein